MELYFKKKEDQSADPCPFRHGDRPTSAGCSLRGSERFVDTKTSQSRNSTLLYPRVTYLYIVVLYICLYGINWGFPSGLCTDSKTTKKKVKLYFMRKRKISHSFQHIWLSTANIHKVIYKLYVWHEAVTDPGRVAIPQ